MSHYPVTARHVQGFIAAVSVATLAGLVGLGGAEFRLPILKGWFKMASLKAVIFNKATSLAVVFFALLFRAHEIPFSLLFAHGGVILNLLSGSLVGAWVSAGIAMRLSERTLDTAIMVLLLALALFLMADHLWMDKTCIVAFETPWLQGALGVVAGFFIGMVAAILGVAGGELLIPTIVLLYGVDIKLAGSLALAISLPTMLVGFFRYSRGAAFEVLRQERALLVAMLVGSVVGAGVGALMLGMVETDILVLMLSFLLMVSAIKIFKHRKDSER